MQHLPSLPYDDMAECLATVKASQGASASSKLALEFPILTAARSGLVRKAAWDEIELGGAAWTLPAERMTANLEHRVPLSSRVVAVLEEATELSGGGGLVFPGTRPRHATKRNHVFEAAPGTRLRDRHPRLPLKLPRLLIPPNDVDRVSN